MQEAQNEVNGWEGATREVNTPATRLLSRPANSQVQAPASRVCDNVARAMPGTGLGMC